MERRGVEGGVVGGWGGGWRGRMQRAHTSVRLVAQKKKKLI